MKGLIRLVLTHEEATIALTAVSRQIEQYRLGAADSLSLTRWVQTREILFRAIEGESE